MAISVDQPYAVLCHRLSFLQSQSSIDSILLSTSINCDIIGAPLREMRGSLVRILAARARAVENDGLIFVGHTLRHDDVDFCPRSMRAVGKWPSKYFFIERLEYDRCVRIR